MPSRRIEQTFQCTPDTFWHRVFFDPEYNRRLFLERLRFERWEQISHTPTADGFRRVVEVVPRLGEVPAAIKALLKDGAGYREEGEFIASKSLYCLNAIPHVRPDRIHISGEMLVEPLGPGQCKRTYTGVVKVDLFGVGGLLEQRLLDDVDKGYSRAGEVTERFIEDMGLRGT